MSGCQVVLVVSIARCSGSPDGPMEVLGVKTSRTRPSKTKIRMGARLFLPEGIHFPLACNSASGAS